MEILEAFDATGCAHSAAQSVGVDPRPCAGMSPRARRAGRSTARSGDRRSSTRSWPRLRSGWTVPMAASAPMWCTSGCRGWGSPVTSGPPAARSRRPGTLGGWAASSLSAVDHRTRALAAVRLGHRPDRVRSGGPATVHVAVLRLVGVVTVPPTRRHERAFPGTQGWLRVWLRGRTFA
jgi:hypothetical protein